MGRWLRLGLLGFAGLAASCNCGGRPVLRESLPVLSLPAEELDFGPVQELTQKSLPLRVENQGRGALRLGGQVEPAGSEFSIGSVPEEVAPGEGVELQVTFSPVGAGADEAELVLTSDDPDAPTRRVRLKGGPIFPAVSFRPDPLSFAPTASPLETRVATLVSSGLATLHVTAVGVAQGGNPDFSVRPPTLPATLQPGEELGVEVVYARSAKATEGRLEVHSDDPEGVRYLSLLPDPPKACSDGDDNDGDGLADFPDDPGCTSADDADEYNPPECLSGATQPCGSSVGACRMGTRTCTSSVWGPCDGSTDPEPERCDGQDNDCDGQVDEGITETCTVHGCAGTRICVPGGTGTYTACAPTNPGTETCNGQDDDCDGTVDEGCGGSCNPDGTYLKGGSPIVYSCCLGMVDVNIDRFTFKNGGAAISPGLSFGPAKDLLGSATSCPDGGFTNTLVVSGGCTETYRLTGAFTGPDTWSGTFSMTFSGTQCDCYGLDACTNQSFSVSASR